MISAFQRFSVSAFWQKLWLLPLAWLWLVLINDLRVEWTVNPQYSYGWAVPFLCAFLIWKNAETRKINAETLKPETLKGNSGVSNNFSFSTFQFFSFCLLALLYFPTRLIEEANPGWRLVSWALALEVVGITLCLLRLMTDGRWQMAEAENPSSVIRLPFSAFLFSICYFLVAVPWPSLIEMPLIQGLTRLDTAFTTEVLGWVGIPAMPHGNVIEVATGMVGIDEACSGIRSFQATLMISLFLGEFYRLSVIRRSVLCLAGFALSFLFNLARMSLLVWVAARKGVPAIASWHDPAGVTILVACFFCLWGMGVGLKGKAETLKTETLKGESGGPFGKAETLKAEKLKLETLKTESGKGTTEGGGTSGNNFSISAFQFSAFALCIWILVTEISVEAWYRWHEARVPVAAQWTIAWPTNNPTFKESPLTGTARQILRYDEGRSAGWDDNDLKWQAVFLRWKPGRTAVHLAENHTPNVCMTAAGYTLDSIASQEWLDVGGLRLPFSVNKVENAARPFYVFYCLWDDRAGVQGFQTMGLSYGRRLSPVLAGLRNPGQRSLEISVSGPGSAAEAEAAVREELGKMIISKGRGQEP